MNEPLRLTLVPLPEEAEELEPLPAEPAGPDAADVVTDPADAPAVDGPGGDAAPAIDALAVDGGQPVDGAPVDGAPDALADGDASPIGDTDGALELTVPGHPMTRTHRAASNASHHAGLIWAGVSRRYSRPGTVWTDPPESLAEHVAYHLAKPAPWVPDDGQPHTFATIEGRVWGMTFGLLWVSVFAGIRWVGGRQSRALVTLLVLGIIALAHYV